MSTVTLITITYSVVFCMFAVLFAILMGQRKRSLRNMRSALARFYVAQRENQALRAKGSRTELQREVEELQRQIAQNDTERHIELTSEIALLRASNRTLIQMKKR